MALVFVIDRRGGEVSFVFFESVIADLIAGLTSVGKASNNMALVFVIDRRGGDAAYVKRLLNIPRDRRAAHDLRCQQPAGWCFAREIELRRLRPTGIRPLVYLVGREATTDGVGTLYRWVISGPVAVSRDPAADVRYRSSGDRTHALICLYDRSVYVFGEEALLVGGNLVSIFCICPEHLCDPTVVIIGLTPTDFHAGIGFEFCGEFLANAVFLNYVSYLAYVTSV